MRNSSGRTTTWRMLVCGGVVLALQACSDGVTPAGLGAGEPRVGMVVNNSPNALDQRMQRQSTIVPFAEASGAGEALRAEGGGSKHTSFLHVASVLPPQANGQTLPATHIATFGTLVYVSYASTSNERLGAVDVFDCKDPANPKLISNAVFTGTKVFSLALDATGSNLYLGTSTSDDGFSNPAVVEAIPLDHGKLTDKSIRQSVSSWAVTGVQVINKKVWATSGTGAGLDQGGVTVLDAYTLEPKQVDAFDDARGVAGSTSQILVAQGQPGRLRLYNADFSFRSSVDAGGLSSPDAKSTVSVSSDWGFMSLGSAGAAVFRTSSPAVVVKLPAAQVPAGVDPADVVTNAVVPITISRNSALVYTADGGAGIRVWYSNFPRTSQSKTPKFTYLGVLPPSQSLPGSTNMVGATSKTLLAANGLGGLRLFYFSFKSH